MRRCINYIIMINHLVGSKSDAVLRPLCTAHDSRNTAAQRDVVAVRYAQQPPLAGSYAPRTVAAGGQPRRRAQMPCSTRSSAARGCWTRVYY